MVNGLLLWLLEEDGEMGALGGLEMGAIIIGLDHSGMSIFSSPARGFPGIFGGFMELCGALRGSALNSGAL
jgi:hypothetical protein